MTSSTKLKYCDAMKEILEDNDYVSKMSMREKVRIVTETGKTENEWVFVSEQLL